MRNILALPVTTSPTSPLPLVTAFCKVPSLYVSTMVSPSNFHERSPSFPFSQSASSSLFFVLARDSMADSCRSFGSSSTAS